MAMVKNALCQCVIAKDASVSKGGILARFSLKIVIDDNILIQCCTSAVRGNSENKTIYGIFDKGWRVLP